MACFTLCKICTCCRIGAEMAKWEPLSLSWQLANNVHFLHFAWRDGTSTLQFHATSNSMRLTCDSRAA
jgi:hypothetical protein